LEEEPGFGQQTNKLAALCVSLALHNFTDLLSYFLGEVPVVVTPKSVTTRPEKKKKGLLDRKAPT
jgi:hypothetical protein